jgi:hypothetical protein
MASSFCPGRPRKRTLNRRSDHCSFESGLDLAPAARMRTLIARAKALNGGRDTWWKKLPAPRWICLATAKQDELRETSRTCCVVCCGRAWLLHPSPSAWRPPSPSANALLKASIKIGSVVTLGSGPRPRARGQARVRDQRRSGAVNPPRPCLARVRSR